MGKNVIVIHMGRDLPLLPYIALLYAPRFPGFGVADSISIAKSSNVQMVSLSPACIAGGHAKGFVNLDPVVIDSVNRDHPHVIFKLLEPGSDFKLRHYPFLSALARSGGKMRC